MKNWIKAALVVSVVAVVVIAAKSIGNATDEVMDDAWGEIVTQPEFQSAYRFL